MHQFHKLILSWNSTRFGQFFCPLSGVYSLWCMTYRFVDSFRAGPGWNCSNAVYKPIWNIPLLSVQWINSWWWTDELSRTCRVSWQNKFVKLVHLVGFIIKKFVTMHGHTNVKLVYMLSRYSLANRRRKKTKINRHDVTLAPCWQSKKGSLKYRKNT